VGKMTKKWLLTGTAFGFLSVAIGAFGAHGLKNVLNDYGRDIFHTGVLYQMFHSLALIGTGIIQNIRKIPGLDISGWCFTAGIFLFSGSLYIIAVTGLKSVGVITPVGGVAFLIAWCWLFIQILKDKR
jgi:uncharacterized membrane protein YgdD (TMEM256/DUF423 family)